MPPEPEYKYRQLARHNSVCNEVYYKMQDCVRENPVKYWLGECTKLSKEVDKCIKENRENMRNKNRQLAQERLEKFKSAGSASTKQE